MPTQIKGLAVIGCGHWGRNLIRNFNELGVLRAVCDTDEGAAQRQAVQTGADESNLDQVFGRADIDSVAIATPPATHASLAGAALRAGKHVFVEKPMALDPKEGEMLCALAAETKRILMVGHLLQYHPAFQRLRELAVSGAFGRLRYVYSNRANLGQFRREENILWSFAPHDISMMIALIGDDPEEVTTIGHPYLHRTIADITTTHLKFPTGANGHIFVSWLHPFKDHKLVVVGDSGMAVFDDALPWQDKLRLYRHEVIWKNGRPEPSKAEPESVQLQEHEPLAAECTHFLDCISANKQPRTDGREGLRVLRVLHAAEASKNQNGKPVRLTNRSDRREGARIFVHDTAMLDDAVSVGDGSKIWHYSHILSNVHIGTGCTIGQNVMIGPDVTIGNRCNIQNNVSIYKGIMLEDGVFCGPSCVFTNVNTPRAEIERKDEFEPTLVRRGATIGANATVVCGVTLGEYCFVAAGATVTRDVLPYALVAGTPAKHIGWVGRAGERLADDLVCRRTGERYELDPSGQLKLAR